MDTELSEEDVERIRADFPENTAEHIARVRRLLAKAQPGNVPWRILENQYGFDGDWQASDAGMHWGDNR